MYLGVDAVIDFSKGGNGKAKFLASSLFLDLYRSLDSSKKELVKREMRASYILIMNNEYNNREIQRVLVKRSLI